MAIITITGPSGSGKSTLEKFLCEAPEFHKVVSYTTRPKREGELSGLDYYFVNEDSWHEYDFAEETEFCGNRYGVGSSDLLTDLEDGVHSVVVCEPNGLQQLTEYAIQKDVTMVSVYLANTPEILIERIISRDPGSDPAKLAKRVAGLSTEVKWYQQYHMHWDIVDLEFGPGSEDGVIKKIRDHLGMSSTIPEDKDGVGYYHTYMEHRNDGRPDRMVVEFVYDDDIVDAAIKSL